MFVHQNFPGQYLHILRSLLADNEKRPGTHELVFMTEPNMNNMIGVRKVTYAKPPLSQAGRGFPRSGFVSPKAGRFRKATGTAPSKTEALFSPRRR